MRISSISNRYRELAAEIAATVKPEIGDEIVITGSTSRGQADQYSDLEINIFGKLIPSEVIREKWLQSIGATGILLKTDVSPLADGSIWAACDYKGVRLEIGWQTYKLQDMLIRSVLSCENLNHWALIGIWALRNSIQLTEGNRHIEEWKSKTDYYPNSLKAAVISDRLKNWSRYNALTSRVSLSKRGQYIGLYGRLLMDVEALYGIVFALNNKWEPDWKWVGTFVESLDIKPLNMPQKVDRILLTEPQKAVEDVFRLSQEVFELLNREGFDTSHPTRNVKNALIEQVSSVAL